MSSLRGVVSPWAIGALAAWLLVMVVVTQLALPVFANVAGPGLQCPPTTCPTRTTTEWLPSLLVGVIAASLAVGTGWGMLMGIRRRR